MAAIGSADERSVANAIVSSPTPWRAKQSCASAPTDGCSWANAIARSDGAATYPREPRVAEAMVSAELPSEWISLNSLVGLLEPTGVVSANAIARPHGAASLREGRSPAPGVRRLLA